MIYEEELKIIDLFRTNVFAEITLNEVMKRLGKRSYNWTYKAIERLSSLKVLNTKKTGRTLICNYNIENPTAISYLAYVENIKSQERVPEELSSKVIKSLTRLTPFFVFSIGGSYAEGRARKDSDVDLVVIVEDEKIKKKIAAYLKDAIQLITNSIDEHIFTKEEFKKMLINQEENFGKELARKHVIVYGADSYYSMILEAHQNGFQG